MSFYTQSTADRWRTMPLKTQLLHIGSELKRVEHWFSRGDSRAAVQAAERALELFDLSVQGIQAGPRRRELCRGREILKGVWAGAYPASDVTLLARAWIGDL